MNLLWNGNDDISSEEHFENSKTKRGTYLLLELFFLSKFFNSISWRSPVRYIAN